MAYILFYCGPEEYNGHHHHHQQTHFLEACYMCHKPLGFNRDIFMYKGITAFCSEECRQEQIEIDDVKETSWNLSVSMRALRKTTSPAPAPKTSNTVPKGTVSVA